MDVTCSLCEISLRKDKALLDAKWEHFIVHKKDKYMCRECAKMVAEAVLSEY